MIKSLTFTGEYGYISEKLEEPINPVRGYIGKGRKYSEEENEQIKRYKKIYKATFKREII